MNKRTIGLINKLQQPYHYTLDSLADYFETTTRTIRKDIDEINGFLANQNLHFIDCKYDGLLLVHDDFQNLVLDKSVLSLHDYHLSKRERLIFISTFIVENDGYTTIQDISDWLGLSRNTIVSDLPDVRNYFSNTGLTIKSETKGLVVTGLESSRRTFLMKQYISLEDNHFLLKHLFPENNADLTIKNILRACEKASQLVFRDCSFQYIHFYLELLIKRLNSGYFLQNGESVSFSTNSLVLSRNISEEISKQYSLKLTTKEVEFFASILDKVSFIQTSLPNRDVLRLQFLSRKFIKSISDAIKIDLTSDFLLLENLSKHLETVFYDKEMVYPDNEVLAEIVADNADIVTAIENNIDIYDVLMLKRLNKVDIAYIAVHICGAIERKKISIKQIRVVVACHAGLGTSRLLKNRLKENFNFDVVAVVTAHEAESEQYEADLIITTVPLRQVKAEVVFVSASLSETDIAKINLALRRINLASRNTKNEIQNSTQQLESKLLTVLREFDVSEALMKKVSSIFEEFHYNQQESTNDLIQYESPKLSELLTLPFIELNGQAKTWQDAIRASAQPLLKKGYISEDYIHAMIHNVNLYGPYIIVAPGVAVAHSDIGEHVHRLGMSFYKLSQPVFFENLMDNPINYMVCLGAIDYEMHVPAFLSLVKLVQEPMFREKLDKINTASELIGLIKELENTL